jgi:7,8-dihydropterin-6-yl-methyl-4-(beta-D-ribofuranosyl)aminobenzene 5'-phosphate synthase
LIFKPDAKGGVTMSFRLSPAWWPFLALASPLIVPWLFIKNLQFRKDTENVARMNQSRMNQAEPLEIPEINFLELTVVVEWKAKEGFIGDAGVSYLFKTDLGSMLYDVGFGPTRPAFTHNAVRLGLDLDQVDALTISHLHCDHMGGIPAQRSRKVTVPENLTPTERKVCYLPDMAEAEGFEAHLVEEPKLLAAGIASSGPLARRLFIMGLTEEQAIVARIKNKGLAVFTGCGHPTMDVILKMVRQLSREPIYAVGGGLHFPITDGRGNRAGIKFQTLIGTGKPPWQKINNEDLDRTITTINAAGPKKVYLSGHDTCDYALARMKQKLKAETEVLQAGETYRI